MSHHAPPSVRQSIRKQEQSVLALAALGIGFIVIYAAAGTERLHGVWAALPVASGAFLLLYARRLFGRAKARRHGLAVEQRVLPQAIRILKRRGFAASGNVRTRNRGDIDLVIGNNHHQVPVEIKSFHSWDRSDRCAAALEQVQLQRVYLGAQLAYIWLPDAKVGLWRRWRGTRRGEVTVVYGHARNLARIARRQVR